VRGKQRSERQLFASRSIAELQRFFGAEDYCHEFDAECVAQWIDSIRDRIGVAASTAGLTPRDYAATLVALLADPNRAPSWPFHGEYASTTRFIIDDPQAQFEVVHIDFPIDRFAVFSDGIEYLVLDQRNKSLPAPFFERLLQPVNAWEGYGRSRPLSRHLRNYLTSETVCARTDDDKSLILGARPRTSMQT
jgi:hypothetical protein